MALLSQPSERAQISREEIERQLQRTLAGPEFKHAERMQRFLRFVVTRTLEGDTGILKESVIGVQVFDREAGYDPKTDSIVRVEARRLRYKLFEYQSRSGSLDPLWILLPKGGYVPEFVWRETEAGSDSAVSAAPQRSVLRGGVAALAGLLICGAVAGFVLRSHAPPPPLQGRPITTWPGYEVTPSFSPDGGTIAFASRSTYLQRLNSDQTERLTQSDQGEIEPVWSPDGSQVAVFRQEPGGKVGIVIVTVRGRQERRIGQITSSLPLARMDWSPDGQFIVTSDRAPSGALGLILISVASGSWQWLSQPPARLADDWCPRFSPSGDAIAYVHRVADGVQDLYMLPFHIARNGQAAPGSPHRITSDNRAIYGHAWMPDGQSIVVASQRSGSYRLWRVPARGGLPVLIEGTEGDAIQPNIARKGQRLVYVSRFTDMNIWRAAIDGRTPPRALIDSTWYDTDPQYSPDGRRIAFRSTRSGNSAIWVADSEGQHAARIADLKGPYVGPPRWSPDGRQIAFDARFGEQSVIYTASTDGSSAPVPLVAPTGSSDMLPNWSHDGKWIYFASIRSGRWQIWKQPAGRERPEQVTTQGGFSAFESVDGASIYYSKGPNIPGIWKLPGEELVLPSASAPKWGWTLGKSGIYYVEANANEELSAELRYFDFASRQSRVAGRTSAKPAQGGTSLSVSPDERWILFAQVDRAGSDIILLDGFH